MTDFDGRAHVGPEHPIDVAVRSAYGGAPVPRRPSKRSVWGWRVALLLPLAAIVLAALDMVTAPPLGPRTVSAAAATLTIVVVMVWVWWAAGRPRLDPTEARQMRSALGRATHREVGRALRRREAVAPELRSWAAALLCQQQAATLPVTFAIMAGANHFLHSASDPFALPSTSDGGRATLSVICALAVLVGVASRWWIHRGARHLGLPLEPPAAAEPP